MAWKSEAKEIIEEPAAEAAVNAALEKWPRFDDAWAALCWLVARKSDSLGLFQDRDGKRFRVYKSAGDKTANTPDITIVYTHDENNVVVHDLKAEERQEAQEEATP